MKPYFKNLSRREVETKLPVDFILKNERGKNLFILLHGFSQSAEIIFSKLGSVFPETDCVLAVNGPFPLPVRKEKEYEVGFAWYLYDPFTDEYLIDQKPAVDVIKNLVTGLNLEKKKKCIVGYSQGGYQAPFVAQELYKVDRVIGISCQFLKSEIKKPAYRLDSIHGEKDEVVDIDGARRMHKVLLDQGVRGEFISVAGEGHRLSSGLVKNLEKLIRK